MNNLFKNGLKYFRNWLIFTVIAAILFIPSFGEGDLFWKQKLINIINSLPFGVIAWFIFTTLQNTLNEKRKNSLLYIIIFSSWMIGKIIIYLFNSFI